MSTKNLEKIKTFSLQKNLRELRNTHGMTINRLAETLDMSFTTVKSYETQNNIPPLQTLIKISKHFKVSLDFLILWNKTPYIHSTQLVSLAAKIDKISNERRFQIENDANTLIDKNNINDVDIKLDRDDIDLTSNIHENIAILRKEKKLTQKNVAESLNITQAQANRYEKNSIPPAENLIVLSAMMGVSIHFLATGQKLNYNIEDKYLKETILKADKVLSLEDKKFLCKLMEKIIQI